MRLNPCPVSLLVFRRTVLCICRNFTPLLEGCPPTTELGKWTSVLSWLVSSTWRLELFWYRYPGLVVQFLWKKWSASNLKAMVHNDRKKKGRKTRGGRQGRGRRIFVSRSFFTLFLHYLFSTVNLPFFFFLACCNYLYHSFSLTVSLFSTFSNVSWSSWGYKEWDFQMLEELLLFLLFFMLSFIRLIRFTPHRDLYIHICTYSFIYKHRWT